MEYRNNNSDRDDYRLEHCFSDRLLGYAYTPGVLSLLVFIPVVGVPLSLVGFVWTLAAVVVGARQALDFDSTGRAIAAVLLSAAVGFIPWIIVVAIQGRLTG